MFPWLKASFAQPLLQRLLLPSRSPAKGGETKHLESGHQAAKPGWSQLSSPTLRTISGAAYCCPSPTPSEAGSLPGQSRAGRRNPSILQPCRWVEEADLMKAHGNPLPHSSCSVSSLARACGSGRQGGGTLENMFTEFLPNHRKSQLLGMKNGRRRQMRPVLCQLPSTAAGKRKPERSSAVLHWPM